MASVNKKTRSLRCLKLWKTFENISALSDVSTTFNAGEITAIIGPNGAGKTTLVNAVTGCVRPDSGRCLLGDNDITGLLPYQIARSGVCRTFQDLRLISQLTVLDNVMLARPTEASPRVLSRIVHGLKRSLVNGTAGALPFLVFVGLQEEASKLAAELSYGQQKLLSLACCLATEAQFLLLDEPIAGLSRDLATRILTLLRSVRDDGRAVVFIEHDIEAVRKVADRVVVMDDGRIIAEGTPKEVLAQRRIMEAYLA
jgi:ABC-type branched-subunit amino acid transport system ATPase component